MGVFRQFPYSNFHEMNMDEIIKLVKELAEDWTAYQNKWGKLYDDTNQALEDFKTYAENYFKNLDITQALREVVEEHYFDSIIKTELSPIVTQWLDDNITITTGVVIDSSLSVSGAAADAKATGNRINTINDELKTMPDIGVANYRFIGPNALINGITYNWNGDTCSVSGTASADSANTIWAAATPLPSWIKKRKRYKIEIEKTHAAINLSLVFGNGSGYTYLTVPQTSEVLIPYDCVTMGVRIYITAGAIIPAGNTIKASIVYDPEVLSITKENNSIIDSSNNLNLFSGLFKEYAYPFAYLTGKKTTNGNIKITGNIPANVSGLCDVYYNKSEMPTGFIPGETYGVYVKSDKTRFAVISYISESDSGTLLFERKSDNAYPYTVGTFKIPAAAKGIAIRVTYTATSATTIDETVDVIIQKISDRSFSKTMKTIGNSFTQGAVWLNNSFDHFADINKTVYGNIGEALGVDIFNNIARYYSSTGILYDAGYNNFKNLITQYTSIDGFDYLMTIFSGNDLNNFDLGNINSEANDGTLAGAIRHIAEWIHSTNDKCELILLSVPPYSADSPHTGPTVFTGNWARGYSIADLDELMYQMSKKYHFIYISWQDLNMSYHYMDFADYQSGYTGLRHAASDDVYRTLGIYAGRQASAINSPIAIKYLIS